MIGWEASLHWVDILGKESVHFLYPTFPLIGMSGNLFYVIFWTFGFLIMLTLLGGGTIVKNKTIIKNYLPKNETKVVEKIAEVPIIEPEVVEKKEEAIIE